MFSHACSSRSSPQVPVVVELLLIRGRELPAKDVEAAVRDRLMRALGGGELGETTFVHLLRPTSYRKRSPKVCVLPVASTHSPPNRMTSAGFCASVGVNEQLHLGPGFGQSSCTSTSFSFESISLMLASSASMSSSAAALAMRRSSLAAFLSVLADVLASPDGPDPSLPLRFAAFFRLSRPLPMSPVSWGGGRISDSAFRLLFSQVG